MYSRLILPKRPLGKALLFFALLLVKLGLIAVLVMALFPADAAPVRKARPSVAAPRPAPVQDTAPRVRVVVTTSLGVITAEVDREHAPITAGNFLRYLDQKRFDGTVFYRAIAHEPTNVTGLKHLTGALSMARFAPGTATGDFSILVSPLPGLDADPARPRVEEPEGYAVFGYVVDGMDVVRKIHMSPTSPTKGEGWMKGQMLDPVVRILTIRRLPEPAPPR